MLGGRSPGKANIMSEYPSQIDFMTAHIESLEAELKFFRSAFPRAAANYKKVVARGQADGLKWCIRCRKFTISYSSGNCAVCNTARR
jgi:hypothetical protein